MMTLLRSLYSILDRQQHQRYLLLQAWFLLAAVIQVAGVVSIAPFIALVSRPSIIHEHAVTSAAYRLGGFSSDRDFLVAFAVVLMGLVILSNAVPALMAWRSAKFAQRLGAELQQDIYRGFLHRDLALAARVNSAHMVRTVVHGTNRFVYMCVQPLLNLVSSGFVVLLITVGLLLYNPVVALSAMLLIGGGYLVVFRVTKARLQRHGELTWAATTQKQKLLNESLGGLKEIRLAGTESRYESQLASITHRALRSEVLINLLGELPRYVLESIALCAMLGLGIVMLTSVADASRIVAVLSLYAMAGYKLLPAAQSVFRSAGQLHTNARVVEDIRAEVMAGRAVKAAVGESGGPMPVGDIEFRDVWYCYPDATEPVIKGLSFRLPRNSLTAIVGSSGTGKSTAADLLLGVLTPASGQILVGGRNIADSARGWRRNVGYVSQNTFIADDTVAANIAFGSSKPFDPHWLRQVARMANLDDFVQTLPGQYDFVVGEHGALLSGGQRQRIGIARALYNDAEVIVLDEPTSALDAITEREVITTLLRLRGSKTVVMISHRLSTMRSADQVLLLDGGRVQVSGPFDDVLARSPEFRELVAAGAHDGPLEADGSDADFSSEYVLG